ncbi:MAG: ABC transporter permease, partial [Bacteroidota bacterium]
RQPAAGHVWVEGVDLSVQPDVIRSRIGVAFQQPALDRHLTVRENLRLHGAMLGVPARDLPNRIEAVLADFRLADRADDSVGTLSGGLTRRADLARALLAEPSVLLLDEPTTGLDPVARAEFWDILSRLRAQRNLTILVSTHLMDEAERCDHLALLDAGRVVAAGTPAELKAPLGERTLWITSSRLDALEHQLAGFNPTATPDGLLLSGSSVASQLASVYQQAGDLIETATVRDASLEDVFRLRIAEPAVQLNPSSASSFVPEAPEATESVSAKPTSAVGALAYREWIKFFRDRTRFGGALIQPLLFWGLLGFGFAGSFVLPGTEDATYMQFLFPGVIALMVLFTSIFSTIAVIEDRDAGILQAGLVSPTPRWALVMGFAVGGTVLSVFQAALFLLIAPFTGVALSVAGIGLVLAGSAILGVAFTALGVAVAWKSKTTRAFHAIMNVLLLPLWILSGGFFPLDGAAGPMQWVMRLNPVTYGVDALRAGLSGEVALLSFGISIVFAGAMVAMAVRAMRND